MTCLRNICTDIGCSLCKTVFKPMYIFPSDSLCREDHAIIKRSVCNHKMEVGVLSADEIDTGSMLRVGTYLDGVNGLNESVEDKCLLVFSVKRGRGVTGPRTGMTVE